MILLDYYKLLSITYSEQISLTRSEEKKAKMAEYLQEYLEFPSKLKKEELSSSMVFELLNGFKAACATVLDTRPKTK